MNLPTSGGTLGRRHIYASFRHVDGKLMDASHTKHRLLIDTDWEETPYCRNGPVTV
jgi:hypothetical protein